MWTDKQPVYSAEQQAAVAKVEEVQEQYDIASGAVADVDRHWVELYDAAYIEASVRWEARHEAELAKRQRILEDTRVAFDAVRAAYDLASIEYQTAYDSQRTFSRQQRTVASRAATRVRHTWRPVYEATVLPLREQVAAIATQLNKAQQDAEALKYLPGLRLPSEHNNDGEAVIAPNGDIYMVPQYEDHGDVYARLKQRYGGSGHSQEWVRIENSGYLSDAGKLRLYGGNLSTETINAVYDYIEMLESMNDADYSGRAKYMRSLVMALLPPPTEED